jgi:hypothetical protein
VARWFPHAREDRYGVIDYGMRAPSSCIGYPLTGDSAASDLFPGHGEGRRNLRPQLGSSARGGRRHEEDRLSGLEEVVGPASRLRAKA